MTLRTRSALLVVLCALVARAADPARLLVIAPVADMHSSPSEDSDVVSQAIFGVTVAVLEETPGWARVRTADQYTGWMPLASVRRLNDGEPVYGKRGKVAVVSSLLANLYREPDVTAHQPLLTVPF